MLLSLLALLSQVRAVKHRYARPLPCLRLAPASAGPERSSRPLISAAPARNPAPPTRLPAAAAVCRPLLACRLALQASATTMRDFRVRGYMQYTNTLGSAACDSQSIAACAKAGRLGLRSSGDTLQLLPPAPGWAMLNGTMVGCPEAFAAISTDASGDNQQATGVFKADAGQPLRQPTTPFVVTPGGTANTLQIRTLTIDCIYQFTVGAVAATGGESRRGFQGRRLCRAQPPTAPSGAQPSAPGDQPPPCGSSPPHLFPCPALPACPAADRGHKLHPGRAAAGLGQRVQTRQRSNRARPVAGRPPGRQLGGGGGAALAALSPQLPRTPGS